MSQIEPESTPTVITTVITLITKRNGRESTYGEATVKPELSQNGQGDLPWLSGMVILLSDYGNHIQAGSTNRIHMNRKMGEANSSDDQAREFTRIGPVCW